MLSKLWKYLLKGKSKDILGDYLEKVLKLSWKHSKKIFLILFLILILILIGILTIGILLFYLIVNLAEWLWNLFSSILNF